MHIVIKHEFVTVIGILPGVQKLERCRTSRIAACVKGEGIADEGRKLTIILFGLDVLTLLAAVNSRAATLMLSIIG
jgi:hypothetical protein